MFGIRNLEGREVEPKWLPNVDHLPRLVDGVELLDTLCPISKETGVRENALSLLTKVLDPKHQFLAEQILQVVPGVQEQQGISDDDALDMIVSRFDQGTPYENDQLRDRISRTLDVLIPPQKDPKEGTIQFDEKDVVTKDE